MSNHTKIAFLGATSMSFGLSMLRDVFCSGEMRGSTLVLVGRHPARWRKRPRLAKLLNNKTGAGVIMEQTTDHRAALDGADFVVNAMAIDRNRLWQHDFKCRANTASVIRSARMAVRAGCSSRCARCRSFSIWCARWKRFARRRCSSISPIRKAASSSRLGKYSPIRSLGLCHGIFMGQGDVARIMGAAERASGGVGRRHQSFPVPAANPQSLDRRRSLPAAAQEGEGLRPFFCTADSPIVPRVRILDDLQRRTSRRISGLRLGGW